MLQKAHSGKTMLLASLVALAAIPAPASADPPPWAPAHGWRKKHDPYYTGYTGKKWDRDYGVVQGRCNTEAVGAVVGGAVGGAVGSQIGRGEGRVIAILVGTAVGAVIGARIGRDIDAADRACIGHALELAGERRTVVWTNPHTGVHYRLTPTANLTQNGAPCRAFTTQATAGKAKETMKGVACRRGDGEWEIRS